MEEVFKKKGGRPRKVTDEDLFNEKLAKYYQDYDIDAINQSNDVANLHALIRLEIAIERLQNDLNAASDVDETTRRKMISSIGEMLSNNLSLQQTLAIDRKTRVGESGETIPQFLTSLKKRAKLFMEKRLVKVYCPEDKILLGTFYRFQQTKYTAKWQPRKPLVYRVEFECPQCGLTIRGEDIIRDVTETEADG